MEIIHPSDRQEWLRLRAQDITSTESPVLFGFSPYETIYSLWHRKKTGDVGEIEETERMFWGTKMQDVIAETIAKQNGWEYKKLDYYARLPECRMGSSFDFEVQTPSGRAILEIKNVDALVFRRTWTEVGDGAFEAPLHVEMQVQHQLAVLDYEKTYIGVLVGGNRLVLVERDRDRAVGEAIKKRVAEFWATIRIDAAPNPDYSRDAETIRRLYSYANPDSVMDARGNSRINVLASMYKEAKRKQVDAERECSEIKSEIITLIGDNERVNGDGFTISAGLVGEAEISYKRKAYRNFLIKFKRGE